MSMGGNIRVTLTLNDAGFTVKAKQASENIKGMNAGIKIASSNFNKMESVVEKTTARLNSASQRIKQLNKDSSDASKSISGMTAKNEQLQTVVSQLITSFKTLRSSTDATSKRIDAGAVSSTKAAKSNDVLKRSHQQLKDAMNGTVDGMTRSERAAKNLMNVNSQVLKQAKLTAAGSKDASARATAAQIADNDRLLASKRASLASMIRAEQAYQRQVEAARSKAMATQLMMENRRDPRTGRMVSVKGAQYAGWERQLAADKAHLANLERSVQLVAQETQRQQAGLGVLVTTGQQLRTNLSIRESELRTMAAEEARRKSMNAAQRQAAQQELARQRQIREEMRQQNTLLREQANMVKGIAQMWASMKIAQGEKASLNEAGEYQRYQVRAIAMGMDPAEMRQFRVDNWKDSDAHPGVSSSDAAEARLAAMGGLATKDMTVVSKNLYDAIEAAKNIQYLQGEHAEPFTDLVRNLYGFVESRQVQYDQAATKSSFDLVTKIQAATGGKIDIKDLETFLRRLGSTANQISDSGIAKIVALLDQVKVSGGGGGGGAGGVSTVGTSVKMLQAYANGKGLSRNAVKEYAEAGVLDMSSYNPNKPAKEQISALKNAGFADSKLLNQDPIGAMQKFVALAFQQMTKNPENIKRYFGSADADTANEENRRAALSKWVAPLGLTQTTNNMITTIGDSRFSKRAHHQEEMIDGSLTNEKLSAERQKTYGQSVDNFNASLTNLKITLGESILPMMTDFFNWLDKTVKKFREFASNNPMVSQLGMIAAGIASVVLGLKGLLGAFSLVRTGLGLFGGAAAGAGRNVSILGTAIKFLKDPIKTVSGMFTGFGAAMRTAGGYVMYLLNPMNIVRGGMKLFKEEFGKFGSTVSGAGRTILANTNKLGPLLRASWSGIIKVIGASISMIGRVFLRAIPFVGWLMLAWDLGKLLLGMQVGGHKISEWFSHWLDGLLTWAKNFWLDLTSLFSDGEVRANVVVEKRVNEEKRKQREDAFNSGDVIRDKVGQLSGDVQAVGRLSRLSGDSQNLMNDVGVATGKITPPKKDESKGHETYTPNPDELPKPNDIDWGGDAAARKGREFENPFTSSLAEMRRKSQIAEMRRNTRIEGSSTDDLDSEARIAFRESWLAGDFDPGHDPSKRKFKNKDGGINWSEKSDGYSPQDWVDQYKAMKQLEEQQKAMDFAAQRTAAAQQDLSAAMDRTTGETGKQNRDVLALERELTRASVRLKNGTADWNAWAAEKNRALATKTGSVLVNFTADFADDDRKTMQDLQPDGFGKQTADIDRKMLADREQYEMLAAAHKKYYEEETAALAAQLAAREISQDTYNARVTEAHSNYIQAAEKAETAFTQHVQVQAAARERAAERSTDKLARDWQNTYSAVESMQENWSNSFVENLQLALRGGSVSWNDFLIGMVEDIYNAKVKEAFSNVITGAFGTVGDLLKNSLLSNASTGGSGAGPTIGNTASGAWSGFTSTVGGWFGAGSTTPGGASKVGGETAGESTKALGDGAKAATGALETMTNTGIMGTISAMAQNITSLFAGTSATASKTAADSLSASSASMLSLALSEAALAATAFSIAAASGGASSGFGGILSMGGALAGGASGAGGAASAFGSGVSMTPFAKGGIMSGFGSLPLKKYSKGGIANSPQIAMFGEGKMNEAYVPLPDGRSIPVTMSGELGGSKGGDSVVISINVENNGDTKVTSEGDQNATWNGVAKRVKALVMDVLVEQKRTNGILATK